MKYLIVFLLATISILSFAEGEGHGHEHATDSNTAKPKDRTHEESDSTHEHEAESIGESTESHSKIEEHQSLPSSEHAHDDKEEHSEGTHGGHSEEGNRRDEDGHGHGENEKFGKGKAIVDVRAEGKSFQLSEVAVRTLALKLSKVPAPLAERTFLLPKEAVASHQEDYSVYRRDASAEAWFSAIHVEVIENEGEFVRVRSVELREGDQLVSKGTGYLRIAELEASGKGGKGHAH